MSAEIQCEQAQLWLAEDRPHNLTMPEQQALTQHMQGCAACAAEAAELQELQHLLAREQSPSPLARARFLAALQQESLHQPPVVAGGNGVATFFRSLWPSRPAWGLGYSAALLVVGLVAGQLLPPRSLGVGPQLSEERLVHMCAVPPQAPSDVL